MILQEKYYRINLDWPNKAGKLTQVLATQKRLLGALGKQDTPKVKELMISVAEGYDVAVDLMKWMEETLHHIGEDSTALIEGSKVREELKWNSQLLSEMMEAKSQSIDKWIEGLSNGRTSNPPKE